MTDTNALLAAGKLEQMCPNCGRWEAAGPYCSWCGRRMTEADWYLNDDQGERHRRMPATAPANPPSEYRQGASHWPSEWGPWPYRTRPPSHRSTPVKATPDPESSPETPLGQQGMGLGGLP